MPCSKKTVCWECDEFEPVPRRALVIKFGAPGDALRTTPVLARLRTEGYGEITWICDRPSVEVLSLARNIDRLIPYGPEAMGIVLTQKFDTVFSFDKDPSAIALAAIARSDDKRGFTITEHGRLSIFDERSRYALRLGIDDQLKFRENRVTVPALIFQMAGFEFAGEEYELECERPLRENRRVVLNVGVGPRWPTKAYPAERWLELAGLLMRSGFEPWFAGGPAEAEAVRDMAERAGARYFEPSPLKTFARHLASSGAVVTCDSLALHVALAVGTRVVGLFCSTAAAEIEWYGRGMALSASEGPCYDSRCTRWPGCIGGIEPSAVVGALRSMGG